MEYGALTYSLNSRSKRAARGCQPTGPQCFSYFGDLFFTDRWAMKGNETFTHFRLQHQTFS